MSFTPHPTLMVVIILEFGLKMKNILSKLLKNVMLTIINRKYLT